MATIDHAQRDNDEEDGFLSGVLIRFGQRVHLEALRRGLLYMNPASYYTTLDGDQLRSDDLEGVDEIHQPSMVKSLIISGLPNREPFDFAPHLTGPLKFRQNRERRNLFCMYLAPLETGCLKIDLRCEEFGDSFLALIDPEAFVKRVHAAANAARFHSECRPVKYFDARTYSGKVGHFKKSDLFSYQREFRLAVWPGDKVPIKLDVGDLTDITTPVLDLAGINTRVKIEISDPVAVANDTDEPS